MSKLYPLLQISLCTFGYLCATGSRAIAQVTSDGTVNTQVTQNDNVAEITGGETRGSNLFHSFQDFSIQTGNEAFFNNADSIANIFSRVTGGNISDIDGAIRANGSASLFLINPAGIVFGENASLNLGGSFYGSTADSILFEDGEFSAVDNLQQSILTINAPIGLSFRDEPGDIVNRSFVQNGAGEFVGLEVLSGQTLALVGGDINFEAGEATASGGNIYLGGLAQTGIVEFNEDGSLNFAEDVTLANITLTNAADIDVRGTGGGSVTVNARNLTLKAADFGRNLKGENFDSRQSLIRGGISFESTDPEAQAGDVIVNVAENITLDNSEIVNQVNSGGTGNSGNIIINTDSLELVFNGELNTNNLSNGNPGAIDITATEVLLRDNALISADSRFFGKGGTIDLEIDNTLILNGSSISALGFSDGGSINIDTDLIAGVSSGGPFGSIITASALQGTDGTVTINAELVVGFPLSISESPVNIGSVGLDSSNKIISTDATKTIAEACSSYRNIEAKSDLIIEGRGGIIPEPGLPLNSNNIIGNGEANSTSTVPAPIETAQGKIQPARGIKVTEDGTITLTAYRTDNAGQRIPQAEQYCN